MSALGPTAGPPPTIQLPGSGGSGGVPGQPDNPTAAKALETAATALQQALNAEQDEQDKAMIAKLLQGVHQITAGRAKEREAAMGTSPAMKFVRRQAQGA